MVQERVAHAAAQCRDEPVVRLADEDPPGDALLVIERSEARYPTTVLDTEPTPLTAGYGA
jgi:hypothetical protein